MTKDFETAVAEYRNCLIPPSRHFKKCYWDQYVYQLWAVEELETEIRKNPDTPPSMVAEEFAKKVDNYSCKNKDTSFMFGTAYDTAVDILDLILALGTKKEKKRTTL